MLRGQALPILCLAAGRSPLLNLIWKKRMAHAEKTPHQSAFSFFFFLQQRFLPFLHIPPEESGGVFFYPYSFSFWKSSLSDPPFALTAQTQTTLSLSHPLTRSPSLFPQLHFPPKLKLHYAAVLHSQSKVIICRRRRRRPPFSCCVDASLKERKPEKF